MAGRADEMLLPRVETDDDDEEDWLVDSEENETRSHYSSGYHEYGEAKDTMGLMEWPPPVYVVQVFSSFTGRWEEKTFARKGDAAGTVADMWLDSPSHMEKSAYGPRRCYIVHLRQFFYIQCRGGFVMRYVNSIYSLQIEFCYHMVFNLNHTN